MSAYHYYSLLDYRIDDLTLMPKSHLKLLKNICGGNKLVDLLFYVPKSYVDRRRNLLSANINDISTFIGSVVQHIPGNKTKKIPHRVIIDTEIGKVTVIFFNYSLRHLFTVFVIGKRCLISGKLESFLGELQIIHPDYMTNDISRYHNIAIIEPLYSSFKGLTSIKIFNNIKFALCKLPNFPEWLDLKLIQKNNWKTFSESIKGIHIPDSLENLKVYRSRLAYDELLSYYLALKLVRRKLVNSQGQANPNNQLYYNFILKKLGFELTESQKEAIDKISDYQSSKSQMMCLLQGDVGSGKTVVALFAALNIVENANQVAFMAPTEILAEQHYRWFLDILSDLNISIELLTGKISTSKKKAIRKNIESGACKIVLGTHALFQEGTKFKNLSLIIIDEQQRFGVMQRMKLIEKGNNADTLFMTATPIPRTLEQILYADMQCLKLTEKPKSRLPISTRIVSIEKLLELISRLKHALETGEKAYWICPYIEDSEYNDISAVEKRFLHLKEVFGDKIGLIHGRVPQKKRDEIMHSFRDNVIKLLIATTVIEVGIDVSDATIIIIENAEQFGLSQLHQLRGRVGRGNKSSFCILLCNNLSRIAYKKLRVICQSQNGFDIAEQDLLFRGSGSVLGCQQSGIINFKFTDINKDQYLIDLANSKAKEIINNDPLFLSNSSNNIKILLDIFGYSEFKMNY